MAIGEGDGVIVGTGGGHDRVEVSVDPATGERVVVVNGVSTRYRPNANIVVRTGDGNDEVVVAPGTRMRVTLFGGAGDDVLCGGDGDDTLHGEGGHDRLYGGAGEDQVWGGDGRDYLDAGPGNDTLLGGRGNDTVYGLGGDDQISGGAGNDYLEGGTGNDAIDAGRGNDTISGGDGDDTIRSGPAHDRIYAGPGHDTVDGGDGVDVSYVQIDDTTVRVERVVTVELRVVGLADVSVIGRLVNQGDTVTIREYVSPSKEEDNSFAYPDVERRTRGRQMLVEYQTDLDDVYDGPPITVLYHELAHVYDFAHGTIADGTYTDPDNPGVDNAERVAVGLPIDHDNDASTPDQLDPRHPYDYTENALRDEIGARKAPRY